MYPAMGLLAVALLSPPGTMRVSPGVVERLAAGEETVAVLISLRSAPAGRAPLASVDPAAVRVHRLFETTGGIAADVTAEGLEQLRNHPDVLAVSIDGVVRPSGQVGGAQIGADRLALAGMTGYGRSVAIVDSGIDATHPDFGGDPGRTSRIVAVQNFVDGGADLGDCNGHGTSVAGVIAGPHGIAPDANLIALKVFGGAGCGVSSFSKVLAAVDWAIAHREELGIDALNLSLGDDLPRQAFCDVEDPVSAALFDRARAAGIAVVAAAGNDGARDGMSWPACFSSVAAVGMVYSVSAGPHSWGSVCRDDVSGADVVPCASNSASGLSVLAPGVSWLTTAVGGGQTSTFSGTSAAAPAATGAVLLIRQARSLSDPALAFDLLRSTGVPVTDDKSHRRTPRLDLGAAMAATSPVTGPCSSAAIPDGGLGQVECEAVVSSLVGNVSTLTAAITIDHPDPTQLTVTLLGPDGSSAVLMDRSGKAGHAVREVFGLTATPVEPLSAFNGKPAAGVWKLRVRDGQPGLAGRLVSWSVQIEPQVPAAGPRMAKATAVFPAAVHGAGRFGSFFTTNVRLFNSDPGAPATVTLRSSAAGEDGTTAGRTLSVTIPPLGTRILDDILGNAFRMVDYGPIFLDASPSVVAAARTESTALNGGAYGLFAPALLPSSATVLGDRAALLVLPFRSRGFRVNVGFTEASGATATVEIAVRDRAGALRGTLTRDVPPLTTIQVNDLFAELAMPADENDLFEVRVIAGAGRVLSYATAIDNETNDALGVTGAVPVADVLIPATSRAAGKFGARFMTNLKIANPSPSPIRVKATFFPTTGPSLAPAIVTLQANETRLLTDVLFQLFSTSEDVSGALRLTALEGPGIVASSHTFTSDGKSGTYGLAIGPTAAGNDAPAGRKIALPFLSSSTSTRTNVGVLETSGKATRTRLTAYDPRGNVLVVWELSLAPFAAVQWNDVFAALGMQESARSEGRSLPTEASAILEVLDGGSVTAYAIQLDNTTNDASFVPGFVLPR